MVKDALCAGDNGHCRLVIELNQQMDNHCKERKEDMKEIKDLLADRRDDIKQLFELVNGVKTDVAVHKKVLAIYASIASLVGGAAITFITKLIF